MDSTFHGGTIKVLQAILTTYSHILHEAEKQPNANALLEARLYSDMYAIPDQVRIVTQFAENLVARLTGREPVTFEGKPTTYAQIFELVDKVLKAANETDKDVVNQQADAVVQVPMAKFKPLKMTAATYAYFNALPNINFHLVTTYGILRKEGVPLGKMDYYAGFFPVQLGGQQLEVNPEGKET